MHNYITRRYNEKYKILKSTPKCFGLLKIHHQGALYFKGKGKSVLLQAWTGPDASKKLRFLDFMTRARDGGRFSALRTGRFNP